MYFIADILATFPLYVHIIKVIAKGNCTWQQGRIIT